MGWFGKSKDQDNQDKSSKDSEQKFLEDVPPKFEDHPDQARMNREFEHERQSTTLKEAWHSVQWADFKNVNQVPCFRQSMLAGGAAAGVTFAVLVTTRSPMRRATNWSVLAFALSSVVSWEQCRYKMRKGLKNTEYAKQYYKDKGSSSSSSSSSSSASPGNQ